MSKPSRQMSTAAVLDPETTAEPEAGNFWHAEDQMFLRYSEGCATPEDMAAILARDLNIRDLQQKCSRAKRVQKLREKCGSRSLLAQLRQQDLETRERIAKERSIEQAKFAQLQQDHAQKMADFDHEERVIGDEVREMEHAQRTLEELTPMIARQQREELRQSFRDGELAQALVAAKARLNSLKRIREEDPIRPGFHLPKELFDPESMLYIGMPDLPKRQAIHVEPERAGPNGTVLKGETFDPNYERVKDAWKAKREQLIAGIPAAEKHLAAVQVEHDSALAELTSKLRRYSYVPE